MQGRVDCFAALAMTMRGARWLVPRRLADHVRLPRQQHRRRNPDHERLRRKDRRCEIEAGLGAIVGGLYSAEACLYLAAAIFGAQALVIWVSPAVALARQPDMVGEPAGC